MSDEEPTIALDISAGDPSEPGADFRIWFSKSDTMGTALRTTGTWKLSTLGKRPHIAAKFTLGGATYQMRLYPTRDACGPAAIVIDRELRKIAARDAQRYGTWEPPEEEDPRDRRQAERQRERGPK